MIRKHFRLKRIALGLALATAVVAPTAQAAVYVDGPTPGIQAGYIRAAAHQRIASEMSVQSPVSQLKVEGMRWQAMAKQYESQPGITAAGAALANQKHSALTVPDMLKVEGMRWMAMANQYKNQPGITAAGAALANQKHSALPVPITQALTTSVSDGGFNWSDAGIGASISFGAALLLLTAIGLGRRSRSRGLASV
jgi:hypothetical protein